MPTLGKVETVYFSILSPEEIRKYSVLEITESKAGTETNSVNDPRLGPIDSYTVCPTCFQKSLDCPGHFGHIELAVPIFHPKFVSVIVKLLKCICIHCSRSLVSKERVKLSKSICETTSISRLDKMVGVCGNIKVCDHCGAKVNNIKYDNGKIYIVDIIDEKGESKSISVDAKKAYDILSCIPNKDVKLLGFNNAVLPLSLYSSSETFLFSRMDHRHIIRPEYMIYTVFPVSPPNIRPPSYIDGQYFPDDLTEKLGTIVKLNTRLREDLNATCATPKRGRRKSGKMSQREREEVVSNLEKNIAIYIHNKEGTSKAGGGKVRNASRPFKSVAERLEKKEGRMRKHIIAKRVNYSFRSVVDGDPKLRSCQLGFPEEGAKEETTPHIVRPYNLKIIERLIREGKVNYISTNRRPGKINLKKIKGGYENYKIKENVYDPSTIVIVDVQLRDGDIVLLNRQPTLRAESIMAVETKIMKDKTLRFNLSLCTPYNADQK